MARATVESRTVPRPVVEKVYVLELSEDEATTLALIFHRIGGSAKKSRRGDADEMQNALRAAGVDPTYRQSDDEISHGAIYFKDFKAAE